MIAPTFCLRPGCRNPGIFVRPGGRVCGQHYGDTLLSEEEALALMEREVPRGIPERKMIVADAASILRGILKPYTACRGRRIRSEALRYLSAASKRAAAAQSEGDAR